MTVESRHADYGLQVNNTGKTLNLYESVNLMTVTFKVLVLCFFS